MDASSRVTKYLVISSSLPESLAQTCVGTGPWREGLRPDSVTYPWRAGSGTARSWGCTPGFRQRTHTGRTLLHFHRRLHHTRHWAAHIRSHLEKGAQIKSDVFLTPDHACFTSCAMTSGVCWSKVTPPPQEQSNPSALGGRGSQRQGCKLWFVWQNNENTKQGLQTPFPVLRNNSKLYSKHCVYTLFNFHFPDFLT